MEVGLVRSIDIDHEMQQAYMDYAMSVIVARALPDARDGLKPVHRRILYAMYDMGLRPDTSYKKSARIVGEVLGKYHPHGDLAVYETMARLAQDFSMRVMLVDGQGNFGSVDGDPPAAMRYTEARLASPAMEMLADIRKDTVNFSDNFDGSLTEPDVLPSALPNLLVNGATGIAVGMSTNIPPHNLGEVVDALVYMLDNWDKKDDISIDDLMRFIQGPDFPTGGIIVHSADEDALKMAYGSGRGKVIVQARAIIEEMSRGRSRILVTELPYMTNKATLIERIAELSREGKLEGVADLRDESDRQGMRIVIELTKSAEPEPLLQELYRQTAMRSTFGIIMLALVDGEPRMLSLKQALRVYLEHRLTIIRRRSEYDLTRAQERAHILEGLRIALKNLDEVISLIRNAPDVETARERLIKRFKLSEPQAQAILDMQLRRLAALERKKIDEEYKELQAQIKGLEALLRSPLKMRQVVADELRQVKETYADRRRTQIVQLEAGMKLTSQILSATDLVPEKSVWVSVTAEGLISRSIDEKPPRMSGTAAPRWSMEVNTRHTLYLVSETGEAAAALVHGLPEAENPAEGIPLHKASSLQEGEKVAALLALPPKEERPEGQYVLTATRQGLVKKTDLSELPGPAAKTFTLVKINEADKMGWASLSDGKSEILLVTADGMAIRFSEDEIRPMGLVAAGVGGIKLQGRDELAGMEVIHPNGEILFVSSDGRAKRVPVDQFPVQGRYGQGVVAWKLPRASQVVGIATGKGTTRITLQLEKLAPKSLRLDEAPLQNRTAAGKVVVDLKAGDRVLALTVPWENPGERKVTKAKPKGKEEAEEEEGTILGEATQVSFEDLLSGETRATEPEDGAGKKPSAAKKPASKAVKPAAAKANATDPAKKAKPAVKALAEKKAVNKAAAAKTTKTAQKPVKAETGKAKSAAGKAVYKKATAAKEPAKKGPAPATKTAARKTTEVKETETKAKTVVKKPAVKKTGTEDKPGTSLKLPVKKGRG